MSSYILKVRPMLDPGAASKIETTLTRRFATVARKFGRGLQTATRFALTGGAIGASFALLSNAILNPLREADQKINDILAKADNIGTRARQFGANEADYFALETVAASKGVEAGDLINILTRMQTMVGDAKLGQKNALLNYRNETNIVKVFLDVVKELNKLNNNEKAKMQAEIFGQKAVGKLAEFTDKKFNIEAASRSLMRSAGATRRTVENRTEQLGNLEDYQSRLRQITATQDYLSSGRSITKAAVEAQSTAEKNQNQRISNYVEMYDYLAKLNNAMQKVQLKIAEALTSFVKNDLTKEEKRAAMEAGAKQVFAVLDIKTQMQALIKGLTNGSIKLKNWFDVRP